MIEEIESQRSYWNSEANSFQKIYSHQKSTVANWLDRTFRKDMYERFQFTMQHCAPADGRVFLDVGCGNGLYSIELAKRGAASVVGIDIAENMLDLCREMAARENVQGRCSFVRSDLLQFSPPGRINVSFGIGLFDYIEDPLPVLKKMREITSDRVILSFPRFWTWRAPLRKVRLTLRGCSVFFYTKSRIERLLKSAGYPRHEIYKVGKLHCAVGFMADTVSSK